MEWKCPCDVEKQDRYKNRVIIISFEDLIKNTEAVMRLLADFLKIEFDDILTVPTFNRFPMVANTSFRPEKAGSIASNTLSRHKTLTGSELDTIEEMTGEIYSRVLKEVVKF